MRSAVLCISCNFHQKLIFSHMSQCPSPWDGGCQTFNFCGVLAISCNFQQNSVLVNVGRDPLWIRGNRKHEFYIPFNFHCECFTLIGPSTASPCSMGWCCQAWVTLRSRHFMYFLGKKEIFANWPPHHIHEDGGLEKYGIPIQISTFHSIHSKIVLEKTLHFTPTHEGWRMRKHYLS